MNLSPQAQRRFRRTMTDGEIRDMARDLAEHLDYWDGPTTTIYQYLTCYQTDGEGL